MKKDQEIQKDVMQELQWEPFIRSSEIGVAVRDGVVTLSGTVDSYLKKTTAEKAAKRVAGVKIVAEDIEVKYPSDSIKNDTEIAQAILNALKWNSAVTEDKIKVKVENGQVTLDGQLEWDFQRGIVVSEIENLTGVKGITNNITLKNTLPVSDLKQKIKSAFERSAIIDAEKISIEASGSKVTLKGSVRSWKERSDAEMAVWSAPGVYQVDNQLSVTSGVYAL
jgi:osmotically-inducible protein OsmY